MKYGATVETEWGSRGPDPASDVFELNLGEEASRSVVARRNERGIPTVLVRRTVTYGPWEEMPRHEPPCG
jgi:hypothetical protein